MLDVLIEATLITINEDLDREIEAYRSYLHKKSVMVGQKDQNKALDPAEQRKFALKLINQLKILIDLLQLQAITKGAEKNRLFFMGFEKMSNYYSMAMELTEAIDVELRQTLMITMQTYLLGIRTVTSLIERMGDWIRISHE